MQTAIWDFQAYIYSNEPIQLVAGENAALKIHPRLESTLTSKREHEKVKTLPEIPTIEEIRMPPSTSHVGLQRGTNSSSGMPVRLPPPPSPPLPPAPKPSPAFPVPLLAHFSPRTRKLKPLPAAPPLPAPSGRPNCLDPLNQKPCPIPQAPPLPSPVTKTKACANHSKASTASRHSSSLPHGKPPSCRIPENFQSSSVQLREFKNPPYHLTPRITPNNENEEMPYLNINPDASNLQSGNMFTSNRLMRDTTSDMQAMLKRGMGSVGQRGICFNRFNEMGPFPEVVESKQERVHI